MHKVDNSGAGLPIHNHSVATERNEYAATVKLLRRTIPRSESDCSYWKNTANVHVRMYVRLQGALQPFAACFSTELNFDQSANQCMRMASDLA